MDVGENFPLMLFDHATTSRVWVKSLRLSVYNKIQHAMNLVSNHRLLELCCFGVNNPKNSCFGLRYLQPPSSITKEFFFMGLKRLLSLPLEKKPSDWGFSPSLSFFPTVILEACIRPYHCLLYELWCEARRFFLFFLFLCQLFKKCKCSVCCLHHSWCHFW